MRAQRGFSLVEVMIAAAIALVVGWELLALTHATIFGAARLDQRLRARTGADRLEERLTSDAASAWSIFVPTQDVNGAGNGDGHEVDFATEDRSHRSYWWAYTFDPPAKRVTRYAYSPGSAPVSGETYADIDGLTAHTHPITDLSRPSSGAYDPLFAQTTVSAVDVDFGWNPDAAGGNHLVSVRLTGGGVDRTTLLASATAPSHFTVLVKYTPAPTGT
ncbi:MAG: prepilin-type N-terminal cleavage/methylation domain-containing protein [Candidatus Tumulicola sp.]